MRSLFVGSIFLRSVSRNPKAYAVVRRCCSNETEEYRRQAKEDSIRCVSSGIKASVERMRSDLRPVHESGPTPHVLHKAGSHINVLRELNGKISQHVGSDRMAYTSKETQMMVSQLAFIHWLETDTLMGLRDFYQKLGCSSGTNKFELKHDDYVGGLFMMQDELFAYVEKRVSCGDYDSPRKAAELLKDIHRELCKLIDVTPRHDFWDDELLMHIDGVLRTFTRQEDIWEDKVDGVMDTLIKIESITPPPALELEGWSRIYDYVHEWIEERDDKATYRRKLREQLRRQIELWVLDNL